MLKTPALMLASFLLLATPALAQRSGVPITQGTTSLDLADQISQARQMSAQTKLEVDDLSVELATLKGRVETLEFRLRQSKQENQALIDDNEALADQITTLRNEMQAQSRAIQDLQARALGMEPSGDVGTADLSAYPGSAEANPYPAGSLATPQSVTPATAPATAPETKSGPTRLVPGGQMDVAEDDQPAPVQASANGEDLPAGTLGTLPASQLPGEAGPLFAAAKARLVRFDYAGAEEAFRAFLDAFGDDPQAGEAHYWLAESLYQQKAYAESGAAYTTMIRSYPDDPRAPDALVKLARSMRLIGDSEKACLALDTLPKRYPNASGVTRDLAAVERTRSGCDN